MKIIILFLAFVSLNAFAELKLSMNDLNDRVKNQNLTLLENAERVYQAKASIDQARLSMLPKLNLWSIGTVVVDYKAVIGVIQDIAPFLVPANWFRLKENELLHLSEKEGYVALRSNELFQARSLFLKVLLDEELTESVTEFERELRYIVEISEDRFDLGIESIENMNRYKLLHLSVLQDLSKLKALIKYEKSVLKTVVGISQSEDIVLEKSNLPHLEELKEVSFNELESLALSKSPELKQFDYILKVLPLIKQEAAFSLLGVPSISRGTAGGIFDDVPQSAGLGFSSGKQMSIIKSKGRVLALQRKGIAETIVRQTQNLTREHNTSLEMFKVYNERYLLSQEIFSSLKEKSSLGNSVPLSDLAESIIASMESYALYLQQNYDFIVNLERLDRLTLSGAFSNMYENIPTVAEPKNKNCKATLFSWWFCDKKK